MKAVYQNVYPGDSVVPLPSVDEKTRFIELLQSIRSTFREFMANEEGEAHCRKLRLELISFYQLLPLDIIETALSGRLVEGHSIFFASSYTGTFTMLPLTAEEQVLFDGAAHTLMAVPGTEAAWRALLICEVLAPAYKIDGIAAPVHYAGTFGLRFIKYWLRYYSIFLEPAEANIYYRFACRSWNDLADFLLNMEPVQQELLLAELPEMFNISGFYTLDDEGLELLRGFGRVKQAYLEKFLKIPRWQEPALRNERPKIGLLVIGVVRMHEHFMQLGHLKAMRNLDAEIIVFSCCARTVYSDLADGNPHTDHPFLKEISPYWSRLVYLDGLAVPECVAAIRNENIDLMLIADAALFGGKYDLIAANRLARRQATLACWSVASACMPDAIDTMITSTFTEPPDRDPHTAYGEKNVYVFPGAMQIFDYGTAVVKAKKAYDRSRFGVGQNQLLYACTAALLKYSGRAIEAWCRILKAVPDAVLVLLPYSPNWHLHRNNMSHYLLMRRFAKAAANDQDILCRVRVLQPMSRELVLELMATTDVYLDAFPFTGNMGITEPLLEGVPIVAMRGHTQRGCQAASHLLGMNVPEGIANSVDEYVAIASKLGLDPEARKAMRHKITEARTNGRGHAFDVEDFSRRFAPVIAEILSEIAK